MFSFPLFERLKADAPEFEQVAAFQAGGRAPERAARKASTPAARPLRSDTSPATTSRRSASARSAAACSRANDDTPSAPPVVGRSAITSGRARYGGDRVGGRIHARRRRASVHRHRRRAARVLRRDAARQSARPVDSAAAGAADRRRQHRCCASRSAAWLRVIGRLRPGASIDGIGAAPHRRPAPVDGARFGLPIQLDARRHSHAAAGR